MKENQEQNGIHLDKIITWYDLAKGVGEVVLHFVFDSIHREAHPSDSEHYIPYDYDGIDRPPGQ
jgi:hypothetical protein